MVHMSKQKLSNWNDEKGECVVLYFDDLFDAARRLVKVIIMYHDSMKAINPAVDPSGSCILQPYLI